MGALARRAIAPMFPRNKWKILRGDKVVITAGKDRGQTGTVLKVIRDEKFPRVIVEGQNLSKRHIKRTQDNPGGIVSVESPLHYSNVQLVDPVTNAPVRVTWRFLEDGSKVRQTRGRLASNSIIPRPELLKQRAKPLPVTAGPSDTPAALALKRTHTPGDLPSFMKQQRRQVHDACRQAAAAGPALWKQNLFGSSSSGSRSWRQQGTGLWRGFAACAF